MEETGSNIHDWQIIDSIRKEIDRIDEGIISLIIKRQKKAYTIGEIKKRLGIKVFDISREKEIKRRLLSFENELLKKDTINAIFTEIISASRAVQSHLAVGYLGPETTFSHQAALSFFGKTALMTPGRDIGEVFELVEKKRCDMGVVPVENSYEGSVRETLDLFYKYDLKIISEIFLPIKHNLLSKEDSIKKITHIYSHPMAIAQCREWIKKNLPDASLRDTESTAQAAKLTAKEKGAACIGSLLAAKEYALNILEEAIQDMARNITRFFVIGRKLTKPTGNDKTSLLFALPNEAGALFHALKPLAERQINMTRIESRPMKIKQWEYLFFVDIEGHRKDKNVKDGILEMASYCTFLKDLGSYPSGGELWD